MNTHTTYTFEKKEDARQEMHRWMRGDKDGERHTIWEVRSQQAPASGHKGKTIKQSVFGVDASGKRTTDKNAIVGWAFRVEN